MHQTGGNRVQDKVGGIGPRTRRDKAEPGTRREAAEPGTIMEAAESGTMCEGGWVMDKETAESGADSTVDSENKFRVN